MPKARLHTKRRAVPGLFIVLLVVGVLAAVLFSFATQAQGSGQEDSSTLGFGTVRTHSDGSSVSAEQRAEGAFSQPSDDVSVSETVSLSTSSQRSITVEDPDPVVVPVAIDQSNPEAVRKAAEVCTLDPLPTAPRVAPDVNDGTWSSGIASAYSVETNDDGQGNFGVSTTASGIDLTHSSVTVAVPAAQSYLVGRIVEVCYDGKVVIATVTDTGGFAQYGRALDLAPGVYQAFGASSYSEWGTRSVYYRFL